VGFLRTARTKTEAILFCECVFINPNNLTETMTIEHHTRLPKTVRLMILVIFLNRRILLTIFFHPHPFRSLSKIPPTERVETAAVLYGQLIFEKKNRARLKRGARFFNPFLGQKLGQAFLSLTQLFIYA
jgi:hypothetical protein